MNKILIIVFLLFPRLTYAQKTDSTSIKNKIKIEELKKRVSDLEGAKENSASNCENENDRLKLALEQYQDSVNKLKLLLSSNAGSNVTQTCFYYEVGASKASYVNPQLDLILNQLKTSTNYKIKVVGHTDKSGEEKSNLQLSKERAMNLRSYLINKKKIPADKIIIEGRGSSIPSVNDAELYSPECRRVEVYLIP